MKVVIGNDHAAVEVKNSIKSFLESKGIEVINVGTNTNDSVDYPDISKIACKKVINKEADFAILICGTGIGISISANKIEGIRCALLTNELSARLSKQHNNANAIAFGARTMGIELILSCIDSYIQAEFEGGRHSTRVNKIEGCGVCEYDF